MWFPDEGQESGEGKKSRLIYWVQGKKKKTPLHRNISIGWLSTLSIYGLFASFFASYKLNTWRFDSKNFSKQKSFLTKGLLRNLYTPPKNDLRSI